jgi:hypothetical protein
MVVVMSFSAATIMMVMGRTTIRAMITAVIVTITITMAHINLQILATQPLKMNVLYKPHINPMERKLQ